MITKRPAKGTRRKVRKFAWFGVPMIPDTDTVLWFEPYISVQEYNAGSELVWEELERHPMRDSKDSEV